MNKKAKITTLILGIILGILLTICFINIKYKQPGSKATRLSINDKVTYHIYYSLSSMGISSDKIYDKKGDTTYLKRIYITFRNDIWVTFVDVEWEEVKNNGKVQYHPVIGKPYKKYYSNLSYVIKY